MKDSMNKGEVESSASFPHKYSQTRVSRKEKTPRRISLKDSNTHPLVESKSSQRVIDRSGVRSIDVIPPDGHVRHDRGHRQEGERGGVGEDVSGHVDRWTSLMFVVVLC